MSRYQENWIVFTNQPTPLQIQKGCMESIPCKHENNYQLDSVQLWHLIRQIPSLKQSQPDLWDHFACYEDISEE